ncbi:hypothetical protein QOT17_008578 [Balamuthia mandrillaris]
MRTLAIFHASENFVKRALWGWPGRKGGGQKGRGANLWTWLRSIKRGAGWPGALHEFARQPSSAPLVLELVEPLWGQGYSLRLQQGLPTAGVCPPWFAVMGSTNVSAQKCHTNQFHAPFLSRR